MTSNWTAAIGVLVALAGIANADVCVPPTGKTEVTIGKPTSVCLVVNGLSWNVTDPPEKYSQVAITPEADEFSRFKVTGSWNSTTAELDPILTTFGDEIGMHVESMGKYSFQKLFRRRGDLRTFPLYTAVIAVDDGEVAGISWDDGCHFCSSDSCEKNTYDFSGHLRPDSGEDCHWPDSACVKEGTDSEVSSLCQLTVYVVWTGTDSKGNYFTSFSKRLSMYAGESVTSLISDAAGTFQDTIKPADP